ncbi:uncharacterized protein BYT42DRAFT_551157 [Radiomyces spectabilis]|uniref:uncharacterized protein n=1 Tax=Radiomyces spectabilis TaxID=64574 RepID=UPI00221FD0D7|nr:uncharacterized protein BYT42DRAFT_551157 [Radiomyces spectabilis]KAI8393476.1 hypothetical protein BYT42DRAFT_551157 [Radiomyces spectabilis]
MADDVRLSQALVKSTTESQQGGSSKPVKRRARLALSCQRCRKHRSKCSRTRPACDQCIEAEASCEYLDKPGDLESTALRDRFAGLEDQIDSLVGEFDLIEKLVANQQRTLLRTDALHKWSIQTDSANGLTIETHMKDVEEIYSTLIRFALDNATTTSSSYAPQPNVSSPSCFIRNNAIYPTVRLSHFTSLQPQSTSTDEPKEEITQPPQALPPEVLRPLLSLYSTCLLHGGIQPLDDTFFAMLLDPSLVSSSPCLQLLLASIICHMLIHTYCWHQHILRPLSMTKEACTQLALQHYRWAKHLLASVYFDTPCLLTIHAICNLVLYHMENGNICAIYLYSGMAVRMALALQLYAEDTLDAVVQAQAEYLPGQSLQRISTYSRSLILFLYCLDTASSHYHNKPYEVHLEDDHSSQKSFFYRSLTSLSNDSQVNQAQVLFQRLEFQSCQLTRDIRRTCFVNDKQQTPFKEIERIEQALTMYRMALPNINIALVNQSSSWQIRNVYIPWIKYHGLWILLHQTYLPTPMSLERCITAAFSIVDLFKTWNQHIDCYFRPCVHELKQACDILLYLVDTQSMVRAQALAGLNVLLDVILHTPVHDIAKTRPFVQRIQQALQQQ